MSTATGITRPKIIDPLTVLNERIEVVLRRVRDSSVFSPDSALTLGQREALDEIEGLADEFVGAVFSVLPRGVAVPSKAWRVERDLFAAITQWREAWERTADSLVLDALLRTVIEDRANFAQVLPRGDRINLDRTLADVHDAVMARSVSLSGRWITGISPSVVVAARHIEWLSAGRSEGSPWLAALALFERGAWPMLLPDGAVVLWVGSEPMRGMCTQEWRERFATVTRAVREASLPTTLAMQRCAALGIGGFTVSDERGGLELEVRRPDLPVERVEFAPLVRVGRGVGSDLCVKNGMISRSHFTGYYVNESVLIDVDRGATNGLRANGEPVTQRVFSLDDIEPWGVGEIEFRLVRREGRAGTRGLLHTGPCNYSKTFSDRTKLPGNEDSGLRYQAKALDRALSKHPRATAINAQIERWISGARFDPSAAMNDDSMAQRWAEERARALFSAVHQVAPIVRAAPARVHVERSLVRACERVQSAWSAAVEGKPSPLRMRMAFALDQLPHEDGRGAKSLTPSVADTQVRASSAGLDRTQSGSVLLFASALQRATSGWTRDVLPFAQRFAWVDPDTLVSLARKVIRWEAGGFESSGANPWAEMFEWWLRGALFWHLPDDEVLVFIPFRDHNGALEVNPRGEVPPALSQGNYVAATLWGVADIIVPVYRRVLAARDRADRGAPRRGPDAQLVYRDGWLWARDVRWDLGATTVLGTDGKLVDDELANPRRSFRIAAEDGVHWAYAPEVPTARETLRINGRTVRGRPLLHGDLVELERDGTTLFSGRYECVNQQTGGHF